MHFDNREQDQHPTTTGEKVFVLVTGFVFIFMITMEILINYEPKKLSALLFIIFWMPLLVIHEFGHALMAKVLGWKVQRVVLGVGKVLMQGRWFNAPVEFRTIPLEGFVEIAPQSLHNARLKHALIYFAGPGIELLLFVLIGIAFGGFESLFTITNDYSRIALQSFAFVAFVGAVLNLVPQAIVTKDGTTPNDGLGIFLCLFSSNIDYENWIKDSQQEHETRF